MTRSGAPTVAAALAAVVLTLLAGCADKDADSTAGGSTASPDVSGRTFVSTDVTQDGEPYPLAKGSQISLNFSDGNVSAQAGCNTMNGPATFDGDVLTVPDNGLATTQMACDQPLMDQDTWFAGILTSKPTVTLDGDTLTLTSGDTVIEFEDAATAQPGVSLTGTNWTLDSTSDSAPSDPDGAVSSVPTGVTSTLLINDDGSLVLHPGCNTGHGQVDVTDTTLTFGPLATTRMMCPDDQMDVENAVLKVLDGEVTYAIAADELTISSANGTLTYRAAS